MNNTKTCTKCKEEKPLSLFRYRNKKRNTYQSWCKSCISIYEKTKWKTSPERRKSNKNRNKIRKIRNVEFVWNYLKEQSCANCGVSGDPRILEFDHKDRENKKHDISTMARSSCSIKTLKEEMDKCTILCSNCHKIRTYEQMGYQTF